MTLMYSDEILSAYLDDELPKSQRQELENALEADDDLRARLERLSAVDAHFLEGIDEIAGQDIPSHILGLLNDEKVVAYVPKPKMKRWVYPIAASLIISLFSGMGFVAGQKNYKPNHTLFVSNISPSHPLFAVLETSSSAELTSIETNADIKVEMLLSFKSIDERYCRQFNLQRTHQAYEALACKDGIDWQIMALGLSAANLDKEVYHTATGIASPAVEAAIDLIIQGDPLSLEEEDRLIQSLWHDVENEPQP